MSPINLLWPLELLAMLPESSLVHIIVLETSDDDGNKRFVM